MCTILFAINEHPHFKFILAANRDEFLHRESMAMHWWENDAAPTNILAGKDIQGGGTWLGINKGGSFATLTNVRDMGRIIENAPSRGEIIHSYLQSQISDSSFLTKLETVQNNYSGFNLLFGRADKLNFISNCSDSILDINKGIHGLSNASLNTPWPKVSEGKKRLENLIDTKGMLDQDYLHYFEKELFKLLEDDSQAAIHQLPDTGIGIEKELLLSPMLIKSPKYGTRVSTIMLVDHQGHTRIVEKNQVDGKENSFEH